MATAPFSIASGGFWRCYLVTFRPYLLFVSATSGLVGLAVAGRNDWLAFVAALIAFFFSYGVGQALTDVFQLDTDSLSSPYRPLVQGRISERQVLGVSLAGLALCSLTFVVLNPWTVLPCALGVAGLLTYTPCKRRWWAGPLYNGAIVALLPAIGFLCLAPSVEACLHSAPLHAAMLSVFASYAVFVLLGYLKDISADRATGYETLPVKYGRSIAVLVSSGLLAVALLASARLMTLSDLFARPVMPSTLATLSLWLAGAFAITAAHGLALTIRRDEQAHRAIAWTVRGFLMLHLAEAAAFEPLLAWLAIVLYALFEIALAARPERSQI